LFSRILLQKAPSAEEVSFAPPALSLGITGLADRSVEPLAAAAPPGNIDECTDGLNNCGKACCQVCGINGLCKAAPAPVRKITVSRWYPPKPCSDGSCSSNSNSDIPKLQITGVGFSGSIISVEIWALNAQGLAIQWVDTLYARGPSFTLRPNIYDCSWLATAKRGRVSAIDSGLFSNKMEVKLC
jgi:hypothetical protein